jgi:hypothetical protein
VLVDVLRAITGQDATAFQAVFVLEALLFLAAAWVASGTAMARPTNQEEGLTA